MRRRTALIGILASLFAGAVPLTINYSTTAKESVNWAEQKGEPAHRNGDFCGTLHDPIQIRAAEKESRSRKALIAERGTTSEARAAVNVHFHIITKGDEGNIDEATIETQMQVLNRSFGSRLVSFSLSSVERIDNPGWFLGCHGEGIESQMKTALRVGAANDLNIYTCEPVNIQGWGTFPQWYPIDPLNDGVVVHYGVVPGGRITQYNTGELLVHEVGHWLGLYHTFQGGCDGDGDFVADTPAEAVPAPSCPIGLDTCPSPGLDPTDNFMDYSGDACWSRFTPGQRERMRDLFTLYRTGP